MRKLLLASATAIFMTGAAMAQINLTINFDPSAGSANLAAATSVHIHSGGGVDTMTAWQYVIGEWGNPASPGAMTQTAGTWRITMDPNTYYGAASNGPIPAGQNVQRIGLVLRESGPCGGFGGNSTACGEQKNSDNSNSDIFLNIAVNPPRSSWSGVTASIASSTENINKSKLVVSAYPNPFAGNLNLNYQVADVAREVNIKVFNMIGQEVAEVVNEKQDAGVHMVPFDGSSLPEGTYFVRFSIDNQVAIQKVVLNR